MLPLLLLTSLAAGSSFAAGSSTTPPTTCAGCVPVFYAGLNNSKCFRIPSIIRTSRGTLLAFSENRVSDCGDNGAHHDLVLRRSVDEGETWLPMQLVRHGTVPCPGCPAAISNPNPVEITLADGKSKAILPGYLCAEHKCAGRTAGI